MAKCIQIVYSGKQGSQCGEPTDGEDHDFCPYHEAPELWDDPEIASIWSSPDIGPKARAFAREVQAELGSPYRVEAVPGPEVPGTFGVKVTITAGATMHFSLGLIEQAVVGLAAITANRFKHELRQHIETLDLPPEAGSVTISARKWAEVSRMAMGSPDARFVDRTFFSLADD